MVGLGGTMDSQYAERFLATARSVDPVAATDPQAVLRAASPAGGDETEAERQVASGTTAEQPAKPL
jgi:hypothetical protein